MLRILGFKVWDPVIPDESRAQIKALQLGEPDYVDRAWARRRADPDRPAYFDERERAKAKGTWPAILAHMIGFQPISIIGTRGKPGWFFKLGAPAQPSKVTHLKTAESGKASSR